MITALFKGKRLLLIQEISSDLSEKHLSPIDYRSIGYLCVSTTTLWLFVSTLYPNIPQVDHLIQKCKPYAWAIGWFQHTLRNPVSVNPYLHLPFKGICYFLTKKITDKRVMMIAWEINRALGIAFLFTWCIKGGRSPFFAAAKRPLDGPAIHVLIPPKEPMTTKIKTRFIRLRSVRMNQGSILCFLLSRICRKSLNRLGRLVFRFRDSKLDNFVSICLFQTIILQYGLMIIWPIICRSEYIDRLLRFTAKYHAYRKDWKKKF